ncbi:MAG TPA: GNAT family N-acetyltransferase [Gaiellaceae bacterium]|nr:GNAT family N-acetyltransferase [Gaiellaceae bacterium]
MREDDGVYAVVTGVHSNAENGVVCTGADAGLIPELVGWFRSAGVPASWLCAEGSDLNAALLAAGCHAERSAWEMRARVDELNLDAPDDPGIHIERVRSDEALSSWLTIAAENGWFDDADSKEAARRLYADLILGKTALLRLYLAFDNGAPVAMASAFLEKPIALLTGLAVQPHARRRGVGRLLALARLRDARNLGCDLTVLAPSPDGGKLYRTLGFEQHQQPADRWFYLPTSD